MEKLDFENFIVYCNSSKSFSYLQKNENSYKSQKKKIQNNEYEKLVDEKKKKYKWIKNLSHKECSKHILENLKQNNNIKHTENKFNGKTKTKKRGYSLLCNINNELIYTYKNNKFIKDAKCMKAASLAVQKKKNVFKPSKCISIFKEKEDTEKKERWTTKKQNTGNDDLIKEKHISNENKLKSDNLTKIKGVEKKDNRIDIYKYLFNIYIRKEYYKKVSKRWLKKFIKKNGPLYKEIAKQLINLLIIKNFVIFDVELWNFFLPQNLINHFNINLQFFCGKSGNKKTEFLKNIFESFPFKYSHENVHIIDMVEYEKCSIVYDYKYLINPNRFLNSVEIGINNKRTNKIKNINKDNFSFKLFDMSRSKDIYTHLSPLRQNVNCNKIKQKVDIHTISSKHVKTSNINIIESNYKIDANEKTTGTKKIDNSCINQYRYKDKKIFSLLESSDSEEMCNSIDLHYLNKINEHNNYLSKDINLYDYKKKTYINNILYPNYYEIALKEFLITDVKSRKTIQMIDSLNLNLEYILISFTKIAIIKQLVWKKKMFRLLHKFVKKDDKTKLEKKIRRKTLGLNLFNGGYSFLLIKNLDFINNFSVLKKNCIMFLLLKYIFIWKKMNLNAHMFIVSPVLDDNISSGFNKSDIGKKNHENVLLQLNPYINKYFLFVLPSFLHHKDRYIILKHLYKKHNLPYSIKTLQYVSKITNSYCKENLIKLFQDEYKERIIYLLKKKNISKDENANNSVENIKQLMSKNKNKKIHFFNKTLNFQCDSHLFIHGKEIELYKKKSFEKLNKNDKSKTYGFDKVVGENELIDRLKNEVVHNFIHKERQKHYNSTDCDKNLFDDAGILLYGESGSGKTFISKIIIEECNCNSIIINCANIFNKVMGESEKCLNEIFEYAKNKLQPCIIMFDGIENICFKHDLFSNSIDKFSARLKLCFYENLDKLHFEKKWNLNCKRNTNSIIIICTTADINNVDSNLLVNHRIRHIYQTKSFKFWENKDVYKLFENCLRSNNIDPNVLINSENFQKYIQENILSRKDKFSPLDISNMCSDTLARCIKIGISNGNEIHLENFCNILRENYK
ncbi:AAA family ATPase, putative [Plasmodium vinckei brucechwatti]|uniref:AAA family ATPase, putative n=1 Tax=Plasmodium vinckei brucechwatti TaxID=119398 RepID=A0A6V7SJ68_PLAVN|nr:AAA family ATPase, putative [Plasmodium vinckei brucechwatti]